MSKDTSHFTVVKMRLLYIIKDESMATRTKIIIYSTLEQWFNFDLSFSGSIYVLFSLSSVVFVYGGFLKNTY